MALSSTLVSLAIAVAVYAQDTRQSPVTYILDADDLIAVRALDAEEISTSAPVRVDPQGDITLPRLGRIHAAGLTTQQLSAQISDKLKLYIKQPDVTVTLVEMRANPVSVLGAVQNPGIQKIQGRRTLYECISAAGGIRQDAGYEIKITRRIHYGRIPLPGAQDDATGDFSVASISIKSVMDASDPAQNIEVKAEDVISVPKGEVVYALGALRRQGGFVLTEHKGISLLQVISLAEGFDRFADTKHARIMRPVPSSDRRTEIAVNLKDLLAGKAPDQQLQPNDLLFVPLSGKKAAAFQIFQSSLSMGTQIGAGMAIYRQ